MNDLEIRTWLSLTRHLPRVRGAGRLSNYARRIYLRRRRDAVTTSFLGYSLVLDPHDAVEGEMCFHPQLCEYREFAWLRRFLRPGNVFVDVGANAGAYSFAALKSVGPSGRVLALEADPDTHARLSANIARNGISNIVPVNVGVAGERTTLRLWRNTTGNRGGNSFLADASRSESIALECEPLYDILVAHGVERVDAMKLDIEGFEYQVLRAFFHTAPTTLHPSLIIMEFRPDIVALAGGSALDLVQQHGYVAQARANENYILVKRA